jgi:L-alanine-DL-glutamate epimerase-like enolase superfamily enzyme
MRIADVQIDPSLVPKQDKEWKFALAANSMSEGWIVSIRADDGAIGYGYASTMAHYGAPHESVGVNLERMKKYLVGRDPRQITAILEDLVKHAVGHNQVLAGIDCALHDLRARQLGIPIYEFFGGAAVREFATLRILPIKSPADMAKNARMLANKGVRHFKIKVHGDVKEDVARVAAVREEVGPDLHLTIDANQSYTPKSAIWALSKMVEFDIDLVEQPVPASDLDGLKMVTEAVPIPVEADEAAFSLDRVARIVHERIADAISLKITKLVVCATPTRPPRSARPGRFNIASARIPAHSSWPRTVCSLPRRCPASGTPASSRNSMVSIRIRGRVSSLLTACCM